PVISARNGFEHHAWTTGGQSGNEPTHRRRERRAPATRVLRREQRLSRTKPARDDAASVPTQVVHSQCPIMSSLSPAGASTWRSGRNFVHNARSLIITTAFE